MRLRNPSWCEDSIALRLKAFTAQSAASEACHFGAGAALVHKDQSGHRLDGQLLMPVRSFCGHAGERRECAKAAH